MRVTTHHALLRDVVKAIWMRICHTQMTAEATDGEAALYASQTSLLPIPNRNRRDRRNGRVHATVGAPRA